MSSREQQGSSQIKAIQKKIVTLYKQGEFLECIHECNVAIKQGYKSASICNTKAIALMQIRRYEKALQAIDVAIRLAPDNEHYTKNKKIIIAKREAERQKKVQEKAELQTTNALVLAKDPQQETASPIQQSSAQSSLTQTSSSNQNKNTSPHTFIIKIELDPAEEIRRYKSLLDNGIIDLSYFEMKKQELQNR